MTKNAHVWANAADTKCVAVHEFDNEVYAKAIETRAGAGVEVFRESFDVGDVTGAAYTDAKRTAVRAGVEQAIAWMDATAPDEWSHPEVCEAIFDAPVGYVLDHYFHGDRESWFARRSGPFTTAPRS